MYFITAAAILIVSSLLLLWHFFWQILFKIFEEIFVVYHVMGGGEGYYRVADINTLRIYPFVMKTELVDERLLDEYCLFSNKFVTEKVRYCLLIQPPSAYPYVQKVILKYSHVLLMRDRISGTLRGTALFTFRKEKNYTLFVLGGLFMDPLYRGETYMYLAPAVYILKELFWHPRTPIYLCAKSFSYKSYLTAVRLFESIYPCYNKKTPDHLQEILVKFGNSLVGINESFDPETCVIHRTTVALKESVAKIAEKDRQNPHIKFFEKKNPGWSKGDCLVAVGHFSWSNMFRVVRRAIFKATKRRGSTNNREMRSSNETSKDIYEGSRHFQQQTASDIFSRVDLNIIGL